jgi:hypothetical protein
MHFPDWNSLDSVRLAHSDLEAAALVFFALLVVCEALAHLSDDKKTERRFDRMGIVFFAVAVLAEIAAYPYGQRNDTLSEKMIVSLDAKSREASTSASNALTKSSAAETKADEAETKSGKAQATAKSANTLSLQVNTVAEDVSAKATELSNQLSAARTKLDDVENKRAELEKSLKNLATCTAPRVIPVWSIGTKTGGRRYNDPLLPLHDWSVLIEYVPNDAETQRAATTLAKAFEFARWHVLLKPSERPLADGVKVQGWEPDFFHGTGDPDVRSASAAQETAGVVVNFLHSYSWQAKLGFMEQEDVTRKLVPTKGILIEIGLYPPVWYVAPPAMKDWSAVMAEQKKEEAEQEQKALKAQKESDDKILSQQTPQMAEIFRRDFAEGRARQEQSRKASEELHSNPCQPLETLGPY